MELRRTYPDAATTSVADAAAVLRRDATPREDRPYLALNFASTLDGRISIGGRSGPIGNEVDRELFHELRAQVDAVMAGAGTLNAERYGRLVRDPERRERRRAAGLEPDPLAVIPSARLTIDPDLPLLQDESSRVVILTASERELEGVRAQVEYLRPQDGGTTFSLAPLLRVLRERYGVRTILCEGGSVLAETLVREDVVDELFLSLAPKIAAGTGPTIVTGPPLEPPAEARLVTVHEAGAHLFLRYRLGG